MEAVLKLRDARELFEQPSLTPFDADYELWCAGPAAEHIVALLRVHPEERIVVELPPSGPGPDEVREALVRYGEARAEQLDREAKAEMRSGLLALIPAAAVFAGTLALSKIASRA